MRRCYIAASMSMREAVRQYALRLRAFRIDCRMRWPDHYWTAPEGLANPANWTDAQRFARIDFEDVVAADLVICIVPPEGQSFGRLVELGVALATADEIWIVDNFDRPKNVFTLLSGFLPESFGLVRRFPSMDHVMTFAWQEATGNGAPLEERV